MLDTETRPDAISDLFEERDGAINQKRDDMLPRHDVMQEEQKEEERSLSRTQEDQEDGAAQGTLEKLKKELEENQRYGRTKARKVKQALRQAQQLIQDNVLDEEKASSLLEVLQGDDTEDEDTVSAPMSSKHPMDHLFRIADEELKIILRYTDDEGLEDKVEAFNLHLAMMSPEEFDDLRKELEELSHDPAAMTKRMLAIGKEANKTSYHKVKKAGGLHAYLDEKDIEIGKLQKKLDKMQKKLAHYEDYDAPRYRIDEMGDAEENSALDTISDLFRSRDAVKRK